MTSKFKVEPVIKVKEEPDIKVKEEPVESKPSAAPFEGQVTAETESGLQAAVSSRAGNGKPNDSAAAAKSSEESVRAQLRASAATRSRIAAQQSHGGSQFGNRQAPQILLPLGSKVPPAPRILVPVASHIPQNSLVYLPSEGFDIPPQQQLHPQPPHTVGWAPHFPPPDLAMSPEAWQFKQLGAPSARRPLYTAPRPAAAAVASRSQHSGPLDLEVAAAAAASLDRRVSAPGGQTRARPGGIRGQQPKKERHGQLQMPNAPDKPGCDAACDRLGRPWLDGNGQQFVGRKETDPVRFGSWDGYRGSIWDSDRARLPVERQTGMCPRCGDLDGHRPMGGLGACPQIRSGKGCGSCGQAGHLVPFCPHSKSGKKLHNTLQPKMLEQSAGKGEGVGESSKKRKLLEAVQKGAAACSMNAGGFSSSGEFSSLPSSCNRTNPPDPPHTHQKKQQKRGPPEPFSSDHSKEESEGETQSEHPQMPQASEGSKGQKTNAQQTCREPLEKEIRDACEMMDRGALNLKKESNGKNGVDRKRVQKLVRDAQKAGMLSVAGETPERVKKLQSRLAKGADLKQGCAPSSKSQSCTPKGPSGSKSAKAAASAAQAQNSNPSQQSKDTRKEKKGIQPKKVTDHPLFGGLDGRMGNDKVEKEVKKTKKGTVDTQGGAVGDSLSKRIDARERSAFPSHPAAPEPMRADSAHSLFAPAAAAASASAAGVGGRGGVSERAVVHHGVSGRQWGIGNWGGEGCQDRSAAGDLVRELQKFFKGGGIGGSDAETLRAVRRLVMDGETEFDREIPDNSLNRVHSSSSFSSASASASSSSAAASPSVLDLIAAARRASSGCPLPNPGASRPDRAHTTRVKRKEETPQREERGVRGSRDKAAPMQVDGNSETFTRRKREGEQNPAQTASSTGPLSTRPPPSNSNRLPPEPLQIPPTAAPTGAPPKRVILRPRSAVEAQAGRRTDSKVPRREKRPEEHPPQNNTGAAQATGSFSHNSLTPPMQIEPHPSHLLPNPPTLPLLRNPFRDNAPPEGGGVPLPTPPEGGFFAEQTQRPPRMQSSLLPPPGMQPPPPHLPPPPMEPPPGMQAPSSTTDFSASAYADDHLHGHPAYDSPGGMMGDETGQDEYVYNRQPNVREDSSTSLYVRLSSCSQGGSQAASSGDEWQAETTSVAPRSWYS